jgi:hypothetical protein
MAQHSFTMAAADGFVQNKSGTIRMLDLWLRRCAPGVFISGATGESRRRVEFSQPSWARRQRSRATIRECVADEACFHHLSSQLHSILRQRFNKYTQLETNALGVY